MMFEVFHGNRPAEYLQAGNPYQACLEVLRIEAEENDVQHAPFMVCQIKPTEGDTQTIPMADILQLQILSLNPEHIDEEEEKDSWENAKFQA